MSTELSKGANTAIGTPAVVVHAGASSALDIAALLVTESGKVRSDNDFVFFNQPTAPGVRLRPPAELDVTFAQVPAEIERIVITATIDGAGTFATVKELRASVRDQAGTELAAFSPTGLANETALVVIELYRRQGAWKVRAVGQGYSDGLGGIATDFGITVEDTPAPAATQPPAAQPPTPPGTPPAAPYTPPGPPPAAPYTPPGPPPAPPAPSAGGFPPPAGPPPVAPPPAAGPRTTTPPSGGGGRIDLSKGKVSLAKGESVSLVKGAGAPPLTRARMGLGWAAAQSGRTIDLDASAILYDGTGKDVDKVWFMSQKGGKGAIRHSGDNLVGGGGGDDEQIYVDLAAIPPNVQTLVFTVNSFGGQKFSDLRAAWCRLIDDATGEELVRFDLAGTKPHTGVVMCTLKREAAGWVMTAIGEFHDAKTVRGMVKPAQAYL